MGVSTNTIELCELIANQASQLNMLCYVVGGVVRDLLLERPTDDTDIDIIVVGSASQLAEVLAKHLQVRSQSFPSFLTAKVTGLPFKYGIAELDLVTARSESYSTPGALPTVQPGTIESDLSRRDFSINAMAVPLEVFIQVNRDQLALSEWENEIIDPHHGRADLQKSLLDVLHDQSFQDDPTRLIRYARYKKRFDLQPKERTKTLIEEAIQKRFIQNITLERFWREFLKAIGEVDSLLVIQELLTLKLFEGHSQMGVLLQGVSPVVWEGFSQHTRELDPTERGRVLQSMIAAQQLSAENESLLYKIGIGKRRIKMIRHLLNGMSDTGDLTDEEKAVIEVVKNERNSD